MAFELLNLVKNTAANSLGGPRNKAILFLLADYANKNTLSAHPGLARLAHETGYSRSTTILATKELRDLGAIIEHTRPNHLRGHAREWQINTEFLLQNQLPYEREAKGPKLGPRQLRVSGPKSGPDADGFCPQLTVRTPDSTGPKHLLDQVRNPDSIGPEFRPQPLSNLHLNRAGEPGEVRARASEGLELILMQIKALEADRTKASWQYSVLTKLKGSIDGIDIELERMKAIVGFYELETAMETHLAKSAEADVARWIKAGQRQAAWRESQFGPAPGQPGSLIEAKRLLEIKTELGVCEC